jgi:Transcriptional regulator
MKQEEIQQKAVKIISEEGFDRLSLSKLATECGIQKASLYHYFSSKDELINSLYDRFSAEIGKHGMSISFDETPLAVLSKTFEHWRKLYQSPSLRPYLSLIYQRRDVEDRADELSATLSMMIRAQSDAILENLSLHHRCLIKDKELLSELFSSTALRLLEEGEDGKLFIGRFASLFASH